MQELKLILKKVIHDLYGLDFDPDLTPAPVNIDADYSTNAPLRLAKILHRPPIQIAEAVVEMFRNGAFEEHIRQRGEYEATEARNRQLKETSEECACTFFRVDDERTTRRVDGPEGAFRESTILNITPPGFINFTLPDSYLASQISESAVDFEGSIASDKFAGKTVICEFSDPNPFKVLHVGHLYTSIVGDSISRLFEYAGAKVIRANFGGDVGLHVAKTMYALMQKDTNNLKIEDIANCYIEGTAAYDDDEKAHQKITKLNKEIYQINSEGISHRRVAELGGPPRSLSDVGETARSGPVERSSLADLYWHGRELSYDYFNQFYNSIGVHFDKYYPESTVASLGLQTVKEQLEKGVYEKSDGAVIFDGDKYGLHTRVFINKEGVPTYETKDVGLIFTKWQDYHFDKSVVITGSEQLDYMKVVLKSVEQYAPELVRRTTHLTHGLVKLPGNIKMSSRKGNFLKAVDVLDMIRQELKDEYDSTDETIALAATKYAFLKYKMGGNIIFDPHESVKMTGNSGPYLLYSAVRAKKILEKTHSAGVADNVFLGNVSSPKNAQASVNNTFEEHIRRRGEYGATEARDDGPEGAFRESIITDAERELMKKLLEYSTVLDEAVAELAPHKVANYLYELAQHFSRFYEACPVIGSEQEQARLKLVRVYLSTMTHGLKLLGINIPEEM